MYIDRVSDRLMEKHLGTGKAPPEVHLVAQVRTATTLGQLDRRRRNVVLQFLTTAGLINRAESQDGPVESLLSGANLRWIDLSEALLARADLHRADLTGTDLRAANLGGANLIEAHLHQAILSEADLRAANLYKADLRGAKLSGATLQGANLTGADLTGAVVTGEKLNTTVSLAEATLHASTMLPDHFKGRTLHSEQVAAIILPEGAMMANERKTTTNHEEIRRWV